MVYRFVPRRQRFVEFLLRAYRGLLDLTGSAEIGIFTFPVSNAAICCCETDSFVVRARQLAKREQGASVWRSKKPKKGWNHRLHVLQGLPGIGRDRAIRLLEHFGTVQRCFAASQEELCEVEGIGAKTARKIYELVSLGC